MNLVRLAMAAWAVLAATTALAAEAASESTRPAADARPQAAPAGTGESLTAKKPGETIQLGGAAVLVKTMDVLPLVKNQFSDRFAFDCFADADLQTLRKQEKLDEVVAAGKTDLEKQILLLNWAYHKIKFGPPPPNAPKDALGILKTAAEGKGMNCGFYAELLRAALSAMGYVARDIGLKGAKSDGNGSEHSVVEVWCPTVRKWILLDPTLNVYFLKGDEPLNAYEVRQNWFYEDGNGLTIVMDMTKKLTVKDMPIDRGTHPGFGKLTMNDNSLGKLLFIAYIPKTAKGVSDYGKMFIFKDAKSEGVSYHTRECPKDPAHEPYWPMQQAALTLAPAGEAALAVKVETMTPDFDKFRHRVDGGAWTDGPPPAQWKLHKGVNTLEAVAVNKFGLEGPVSKVELEVK